jgi:ribosomal protein L21E
MLIKNISDVLFNGIRGTVTNVYEKSVDVNFEVGKKVITARIKPETFSTFDPVIRQLLLKELNCH